ncbi:unnamed protein product [Rhizophagus irregularis]|nr:unnamed protein product [Rhizophagus irregularis]CAB4429294.1 unnamed protein product [Rhizophagus irregularis]
MKYTILFIIVFFLNSLKAFAWKTHDNCDNIWVNEVKWLSNNQVSISLHGPPTDKCIQQGIEIVSDFKFYILNKVPYIFWSERRWINGYNENNISGGRDGKDCSKLYEGAVDYELISTYDPNEFAPPGQQVALEMWLYGNCRYRGDTHCDACRIYKYYDYNPPK